MARGFVKLAWALGLVSALALTDEGFERTGLQGGLFVTDAQAVVGRRATPRSVAGVARRTTRRVVRRSTIYVAALPGGCARTSVNGGIVWLCGGTYYQAYGGRYVVVYID